MSRIGTKLIKIPSGTTVTLDANAMQFDGAKGKLEVVLHPKITAIIEGDTIEIKRNGTDRLARSLHGLSRMLVSNAVEGVSTGFTKKLEMHGIGYRAESNGQKITLSVGFTHPVVMEAPAGITFSVEKGTNVLVHGIDKQLVGQVAANIRAIRKPEPYKGKGIRYEGEHVRRKAGKAAKTGK